MDLLSVILVNLGVVLTLVTLLWLASVRLEDSSIVDPFWGFGFVVVAWSTGLLAPSQHARGWLLVALVSIWGLRLSGYLFIRNRGKGEDRRYQAMRNKHGARFWWVSLFTVFLLQGVIMWIVSLTFQAGIVSGQEKPLGWIDWLGAIVWAIGLFFEAVGDGQMAIFKSDPDNKGQVMDRGLWRYTRHPNYFGDFCVWWGLYLIALAGGGWWTVFCPLLMSFLLLKVSGVTLLEKDIGDRRPGYREYVLRTNAFFPGPRKPGND